MSYAHTKRRKTIARLKRLFPKGWLLVLQLKAARVSNSQKLNDFSRLSQAVTNLQRSKYLPKFFTKRQAAAVLDVGEVEIDGFIMSGILTDIKPAGAENSGFECQEVVRLIKSQIVAS